MSGQMKDRAIKKAPPTIVMNAAAGVYRFQMIPRKIAVRTGGVTAAVNMLCAP